MKKHIERVGSGKWGSHFGQFNGRSNAEIRFYEYIKQNIESKVLASVPISDYIVDVCIGKKIIEFYGDFWHANPKAYKEHQVIKGFSYEPKFVKKIWEDDKNRIDSLMGLGYNVLIVWESEWNNDKLACIEKIKKYLL